MAATGKKLTPMMKQYYEIKSEYEDCILFFRLGDFYEMFGDDAVEAAGILDITLTSRSKGEDALPMCGIPYHSAESYIAKLNQKGKKVAVCEQVSDPKAKGIVERKVKQVLTPSTNTSELNLEAKENQFLVVLDGKIGDLRSCIVDISTGEIFLRNISSFDDLEAVIVKYTAKEIVVQSELYDLPEFYSFSKNLEGVLISRYLVKDSTEVLEALDKKISFINDEEALKPCVLAAAYLKNVIGFNLGAIQKVITLGESDDYFELDKSSLMNLEVFYTLMDGSKENSLVCKIDYTKTAMGGRKLRSWLLRPLKNIELINERQNMVEVFMDLSMDKTEKLSDTLRGIYDLDRLFARICALTASPKDLIAIRHSLEKINEMKGFIWWNSLMDQKLNELPLVDKMIEKLGCIKSEDAKISIREGGIFVDSFNDEVDQLRDLLKNGKDYLLKIQREESEKNDISTLKLGFNKVFGYYLEVSKGKVDKVPDYFIRKQTLTNSERYITPELKEYEEKVLNAQDRVRELEYNLYMDLLDELKRFDSLIQKCSEVISFLDVTFSFAELAKAQNYCKPEIVEENILEIENGRHVVIEQIVGKHEFIPNDCEFGGDCNVQIITGPNMGGKSTFLRQNALICLLAQIGSFVPAGLAKIGVVDQIYSRVGASDNLSRGQSTFMVEMTETAYILTNATERSLIIMDEVGRGTSTSDGLSLAKSITDFLNNQIKGRTLFATHYHELVEHAENIEGVSNFSISVTHDDNGKPIFLHKIVPGGIDRSYGIEVAESAGVPLDVINRSKDYMREFMNQKNREHKSLNNYDKTQTSLFDDKNEQLIKLQAMMKDININETTPLQSLQYLKDVIDTLRP